MKIFLATLGGFLLTLAIFASGGLLTAWFIAVEPIDQTVSTSDASDLWSREPRRVDPAAQHLARLPALASGIEQAPAEPSSELSFVSAAAAGDGPPDATMTGETGDEQPFAEPEMPAAHLEWCASRYRSYRAEDNSYRSYSGPRRTCVSPYLEAAEPRASNPLVVAEEDQPTEALGYAPAQEAVSADHVAYCFSRYRSYRPSDNSYQPYGSATRRQCE